MSSFAGGSANATVGTIKCCLCGTVITANAAAMCMNCLKAEVDITSGIDTVCEIIQCGKCDKWQNKLNDWIEADIESLPLLNLCMRKVPGLCTPDTKILDARWIWTEPHSRRIKICVDIERMVLDEKVRLAQKVIVEFVVKKKQCIECIYDSTDHNWGGQVQIRQHIAGKSRSLRNLEVLLNKAGLHKIMSDIEVRRDGLDIKFKTKSGADKVVAFVTSMMPCKVKYSKKLVSRDHQSNSARMEHVFYIEVVPLSRDDLVLLPKEYNGALELMLVSRMSSLVKLINPTTLNQIEISASNFFSKPFKTIASVKDAVEYMVMDVEITNRFNNIIGKSSSASNKKNSGSISSTADVGAVEAKQFVAAEAEVMLEASIDGGEDSIFVSTHLGHLIQAGDICLGYNLKVISNADEDLLVTLNYAPPDVILVKKIQSNLYTEKKKKSSKSKHKRGKSGGSAAGEDDNASLISGTVDGNDDVDDAGDDDSVEAIEVAEFEADEADFVIVTDAEQVDDIESVNDGNLDGLTEVVESNLVVKDGDVGI